MTAGAELARDWFVEQVAPALADGFPGMPYAAGRLGTGSDVLGLDDETSRDHDWGLRLTLLVPSDRPDAVRDRLDTTLPDAFRGHPVRFAFTGGSDASLRIDVTTVDDLALDRLGMDPRRDPTVEGWLALTGQAVLEVVAGPVFHDDGGLAALREALSWYPDDIWRQVLRADWRRIDQELPLVGRTGEVGDDRGSRVIAARLVHAVMHLAFLVERRWPPYAKWLGTLFDRLPVASVLGPVLDRALAAGAWPERQAALADALDVLADRQRELGLTDAAGAIPFWDRPHLRVDPAIDAQLAAGIVDPLVRRLPPWAGSAEQRTDLVDLLVDPAARRRLVAL